MAPSRASVEGPTKSPLPVLLLFLSATTGMIDAVSVLGLGKVFTANMTGNIVFLGFAATGTQGFAIMPYLIALAAFVIGAIVAGRMGRDFAPRPLREWLLFAAAIEIGLLWLAALVAGFSGSGAHLGQGAVFTIIALTALAMGFRNATIRQLKVPDLTTTVLTLTITGVAADSRLAGGTNPNLRRRIAAILAMFAGAVIGAFMVTHVGLAPPLALAGFLGMAGTAACARHPLTALPLAL